MRESSQIGMKRQSRLMKGLRAVACAASLAAATSTMADNLFSWGTDPITGPNPSLGNFTPAPFLNGGNVAAVGAYMPGAPVKALKLDGLQGPSVPVFAPIYGANNVKYTFADFEGPNQNIELLTLKTMIQGSAGTGPSFNTNQSYLGNFNYAPLTFDPTSPSGPAVSYSTYLSSGVNMANEALYPGHGGFKNPSQLGGTSSAPNIRSNLFTLPIMRMSLVTANLPSGHKHIPYIARFNNTGNAALDSDGNTANGYQFVQNAANPANGQLLSRGDFSALVSHYRMRGADGAHLLDAGVLGYTREQAESDINAGWNQPAIKAIYDGGGARYAMLSTQLRDNGVDTTMEEIGTVASGVYSLAQNKLVLLLSNLDGTTHNVSFPAKLGGKSVAGSFAIPAGTHHLLQFTGAGTQWNLLTPLGASTQIFLDNNRNGVGVPEPTMLGALSMLGVLGLARRRRRA